MTLSLMHSRFFAQVHGIVRRSSCFNTGRIDHMYKDRHETGVKLFLHYGDLCDATNLITIISSIKPTEIYNLGAMSHVKVSFDMPEYTVSDLSVLYVVLLSGVDLFIHSFILLNRPTAMELVCCACWMPFVRRALKRRFASTRLRRVSSMERSRRSLSPRRLHSILVLPMLVSCIPLVV